MGKPQDMIPRYVEILKSDCDARRQKCDPKRHTPPTDLLCRFRTRRKESLE